MKPRYIVLPLLLIVIAVVAVAAYLFSNVDSFRPRIQTELQQKLNRPVTLGHLGLKLIPFSIKVEGFSIGEAPAFPTQRPFATASEVDVSASLLSLIRGNPEVNDLILEKPQIELVKNAAGVWNFSSLGSQSSSGGQSQFSLAQLKIDDGQVGYTDQTGNEPRAVYDHIDLTLDDFAPNKQFGVDLGVHFPGEGKQTLGFKGKVGPLESGPAAGVPPISGHVSLEQVTLSGINRFAAGTIPPQTDTNASGGADVSTQGDVVAAKGDLKLENTVVKGAKLDYAINAVYDLSADRKRQTVQIRSGVVQLGPTTLKASGDVNAGVKPATLNMRVSTNDSSITDLAKLASGFGVAFSPAYKVTGTVSADLTAKGPVSAPLLNGSITAKTLEASGGEIKQPVSVPSIALTLSPEVVRSNTFTATSGATSLTLQFALSQYSTKAMNVDATLQTAGANIAELLNIAKAYGIEAAQGVSGSGKLSLDLHVQGPVEESSRLAYAGSASIGGATISTPDLEKPLNVASANARFSQNSVALDNLAASLGGTSIRGNLAARNFAAPQVQFALAADKIDTAELQTITKSRPGQANKPAARPASKKPSLLLLTTGGGSLAVGVIKAEDIVLNKVNTKVQLDRGVITLSPLSAEAFSGTAAGTFIADMRPAVPECTVKMKVAGVDANALLSTMSSVKNTLYGTLAANSDLRFALASGSELSRTLNGVLTFTLSNGMLKNVNILNEVSKVGKFLKGAATADSGTGGTALKKFAGTLNISNGVATTDDLTGVLNAGSITAKGSLNLVSQAIDMHMTAVLANSVSQSVGGSNVGGYLSTALANKNGELVLPVLVTGNMSHPVFTPDVQAIAKMKLNNLLPTAGGLGSLAGKKGVGGILGGLLGGASQPQPDAKQQPQQQQQQQTPADSINSILNQFKKKKPQTQPQ